jgi:hypothetical protein
VFRIAFMRLLVLFRLVVVASLALYTLPTATFAMHGDTSSVVTNIDDPHADHAAIDTPADHHDHGFSKDLAKKDQKQGQQNCCTDFCISLAIMAEAPEFGSPSRVTVRHYLNDGFVFGQMQSLHRPPSIRA